MDGQPVAAVAAVDGATARAALPREAAGYVAVSSYNLFGDGVRTLHIDHTTIATPIREVGTLKSLLALALVRSSGDVQRMSLLVRKTNDVAIAAYSAIKFVDDEEATRLAAEADEKVMVLKDEALVALRAFGRTVRLPEELVSVPLENVGGQVVSAIDRMAKDEPPTSRDDARLEQVGGRLLHPTPCLLPAASCLLHAACCLVPPASCLLPPASCLLPPASRLPPPASRLLSPTAYVFLPQAFAVFVFPICAVVLGLAFSWLLNRYAPAVPYTPVLLVVGFTVACLHAPKLFSHTHLAPSLEAWQHLSGHLILYVFIPPLIFGDAMQLDFHILKRCAGQCLLLAVPAVMFSTALTAAVAHYVLPYHWSWTLAIAFGAVLSATDPVAVVSLLKSLGASPALTMLIGGESLLNDGTAMVIFDT